jgi:hypothetical protein
MENLGYFFRISNLKRLFFSKYQPAFSLLFVFLLASKGRQNRPADAASPKKKNPSVAPAKLALCVLGLTRQVQDYAPFFDPLGLNVARTVAAADTAGSFFFPSERPTFGRQAHLRSAGPPSVGRLTC